MLHAMLVRRRAFAPFCAAHRRAGARRSVPAGRRARGELSSFQLFWAPSLRPEGGAVLNIAEDPWNWHGGSAAYADAKARALEVASAVVGSTTRRRPALLAAASAPVKVGFRLGEPGVGELGVRDGHLVDSGPSPRSGAVPGGHHRGRRPGRFARRARAAALARSGRRCRRRDRPRRWRSSGSAGTGPNRSRWSAGCTTSTTRRPPKPHAGQASVLAYRGWCGWPAGCSRAPGGRHGRRRADRLVARCSWARPPVVAKALSRHAPDVPVIEVVTREDAVVHETMSLLLLMGLE